MKKFFLLLGLLCLLFTTCSCAGIMAAKTEAELTYDQKGRPVFTIFNNKSYQGLSLDVTKSPEGTITTKADRANRSIINNI